RAHHFKTPGTKRSGGFAYSGFGPLYFPVFGPACFVCTGNWPRTRCDADMHEKAAKSFCCDCIAILFHVKECKSFSPAPGQDLR
ncbi:hypothetical protein, partial [Thalassospira lucentensis]